MNASRKLTGILIILAFINITTACSKQRGPVASADTYVEDIGWQNIYFDFDKYNLKPAAQRTLDQHISGMRSSPKLNIVIEGHCDEWGTEEYNMALGERRAIAAKNYMVNSGIAPNRISTISFGEARPLDPNHNDGAWAKNRRDEFKRRR